MTLATLFANRFIHRIAHKTIFAIVMLACLLWSFVHAWRAPSEAASAPTAFQEWPSQWDGAALRPLALGAVEQRFAERFPGAMTRMTDGHRTLVLRRVDAPTRMLHPATDCYRALGYRVQEARLTRDAQKRLWRCFVATRSGDASKLQVCERIVDANGQAFTDSSAWYWASVAGASRGPWQAVTVAQAIE